MEVPTWDAGDMCVSQKIIVNEHTAEEEQLAVIVRT